MVFLRSNTRSNEVHRVASWSTRSAAECTSWCHEVYFITSSVASQDIQRVVDKKTNEASAELVFLSTTRWISHQIERVCKQREESIKPRAEGEWFYAFLELFANEFNLVEKPPHARDFRSSILELYHNQSIRERTKYTLRCHENRKITLPYFILLIQNCFTSNRSHSLLLYYGTVIQ